MRRIWNPATPVAAALALAAYGPAGTALAQDRAPAGEEDRALAAEEDEAPALSLPADSPAEIADIRAELAALRAHEDIRALLHEYGRTIDTRDWDGFAALFAPDAEYVGGPGGTAIVGGRAIADFLSGVIADNPAGVREPNYHVFFNEQIAVNGAAGRGTSMSAFVTPGEDGRPAMSILAAYDDEYALLDGRWVFTRRVVRGLVPGPPNGGD